MDAAFIYLCIALTLSAHGMSTLLLILDLFPILTLPFIQLFFPIVLPIGSTVAMANVYRDYGIVMVHLIVQTKPMSLIVMGPKDTCFITLALSITISARTQTFVYPINGSVMVKMIVHKPMMRATALPQDAWALPVTTSHAFLNHGAVMVLVTVLQAQMKSIAHRVTPQKASVVWNMVSSSAPPTNVST